MKIVLLSDANSIHTSKWVNSFAQRGHDVYLIYSKEHFPQVHPIDQRVKTIPLRYSGRMGYYLNAINLNRIIKHINPDVINAHYASGYGTLARMARVKNLVLSVWGSDVYNFPYQNKVNYKIIRKNLLYTKYIASTSKCMAEQVNKILGKEERKIVVTPFGIDLKKFNPNKLKKEKEFLNVSVIKNLENIYGIDDFLKAMQLALKKISKKDMLTAEKIRINIYGEGEQEEALRKLALDLEIASITSFKGRISNDLVPEKLSETTVFCNMTKFRESFGVSVVEAMAMEVPVVVTDVDGTREITDNGKAGILVPKGDIEVMAEQISELLLDDQYRNKVGQKERIRVEKFYDWEKNVDIMEKYYREVVESAK